MGEPIKIEDFKQLSPLVMGYELRPEHSYLIICDGKSFSREHANSLFKGIMQMHPDVQIAVVATMKPKDVKIMEGPPREPSPATAAGDAPANDPPAQE